MLSIVTPDQQEVQDLTKNLDEIARLGAKKILIEALQQEVTEYGDGHAEQRDERGHALVVRNGKAKSRRVTLGGGTVEVAAPRVNDKRKGEQFTSQILPPYLRRSANVETLLIAVEPGYRDSEESWSIFLRDLKARGLQPPLLAIGDGALSFWEAVHNIFQSTKEQRCWVHNIANVLDKLPRRLEAIAKELLHEIVHSDTLASATECRETSETVKLRTKVTKGAGS